MSVISLPRSLDHIYPQLVDIYYLAFPHDRWIPKTIVAVAYTLEFLQTILATRDAFRNFGTGWGDMDDLDKVGWLWFSVPVMSSISASDYYISSK